MSKKDEALKLALEALELHGQQYPHMVKGYCLDAITALREALAEQPAQQQEVDWEKLYRLEVKKKEALAAKYERDTGKKLTRIVPMAEQPAPVAEPHKQQDHDCALKRGDIVCRHCDLEVVEASDAPQIARQQDIPDLIAGALGVSRGTAYDMMREVLAVAQQQEPVAWEDEQGNVRMTLDAGEIQSSVGYVYSVNGERIKNACIRSDIPNGTPLYTSPPASKPLTDEEIVQIELGLRQYNNRDTYDLSLKDFARAIEAAHGIYAPTELKEKT